MTMTIKDRISNFFNDVITSGTEGLVDDELVKRIRLVNILSMTLTILITVVGAIYYSLSRQLSILIPASIEACMAASSIFLNRNRKYNAAALITYFTQCLASVYFGLLLGNMIELQAMIIFLFLITFLIFKDEKIRFICIASALAILVLLEANYYYQFVESIALSRNYTVIFKALSVMGVLLLIIIVGRPYVRSNDAMHKANHFKKMFIYQVTHELRTPLNAIYAAAQLLKREVKLNEQLKSVSNLVDQLMMATNNSRNIINNVLDMSQIESGKMNVTSEETFEIRTFLSKIIEVNKMIARFRNIKLKLLVNEMPDAIIADSLKLNQIVTNLLANAIKYSHKDSTVTLTASKQGDNWEMLFSNYGSPIAPGKLKTIFDPFVTDKTKYTEGTGLGLYIVKNIVASLGGNITADSTPEGQTTFHIVMPLKTATMADVQTVETDEQLPDLSDIHVVVAEDDEQNAHLLTMFLHRIGCSVSLASNGREVLDEVRKKTPDIIIMDYHMEEMDGISTLNVLKQHPLNRNIPVIVATGDAFSESQQLLLSAGADAIIQKPIHFKALQGLLNKHLHHTDGELQE
ncbi:hybrid sensor histidine kinase/response regulator [Chitinophaga vietnamensis]|uniref:hybrid sensor histidine kinase/response regulator n=1 Tax=Chitinophaga vietnamensis TaxID=2593957 RepID=UPI001177DE40|nr:hybrid sensor histidine kinase/response regulator [Chitinophaga vietnamensis]